MVHLPDAPVLVAYALASFVVLMVPGITVSTVISTALARGLRGALWFEVGAETGRASMIVVVAVALQAVTGLVAVLFDVIKWIGAAYLLYLGWGYLTSRSGITLDAGQSERSGLRQAATGFLTLWSNPKALIFFGAFLPQFVDPRYPAWPQVAVLGLITIALAAISDGGYIALSLGARSLLAGGALVWVNRVAGVILLGAAVWLATLHR